MTKWLKFCKNKIEKIEKVWNRKLEDPRDDDSEHSEDDLANRDEDSEKEEEVDRFPQFPGFAP